MTVSVKFWTAFGAVPLLAVNVIAYVPAPPTAGVPDNRPLPGVPGAKVMPDGSAAPPTAIVGNGNPFAAIGSEHATPTTQVSELALVTAGAWFTVSTKFCTELGGMPLPAVKVSG